MIKFGPSGNSNSFYEMGYKHTVQTPEYLRKLGLNAFEYSFGRGVNVKTETAEAIGTEFSKHGIEISAHAPYYINFANPEEENILKSIGYINSTASRLLSFGGRRCVFHPGTCAKIDREVAFSACLKNIEKLLVEMHAQGLNDKIILCPETMGKINQLGTVEEILQICKLDDMLIPTFDFGHINSREQGILKTKDDYKAVIDKIFNSLGDYKAKNIHIHFSKIQYGASGEIRHLTMDDTVFGPEFQPLAEVIAEYKMTPVIISESDGTQAEDALYMKNIYEGLISSSNGYGSTI